MEQPLKLCIAVRLCVIGASVASALLATDQHRCKQRSSHWFDTDFSDGVADVSVQLLQTRTPIVTGSSAQSLMATGEAEWSSSDGLHSEKRVAVCIAGQLSRLEISSKVKNILMPLSKKKHLAHVFLALETGEAVYTNDATKLAGNEDLYEHLTQDSVKAQLQPFYQAGMFRPHTNYAPNISRWARYLTEKDSNRTERLNNHMSVQSNLRSCVDLIEEQESRLGIQYDVVLKLRDNTLAPQSPAALLHYIGNSSAQDRVLVKDCNGNCGVSDKVMLLPRKHLSVALGGVFAVFMGVEEGDLDMITTFAQDTKIVNPEQLLKKVLLFHNVSVMEVSSTVLPFVDARCFSTAATRHTEWCPVAEWKDCRPAQPWNIDIPKFCDSLPA